MRYVLIILFSLLAGFSGCGINDAGRTVEGVLPAMPDHWSGRSWTEGCRVVYRTCAGAVGETVCFPDSSLLLIDVPPGSNLPVLVYPVGGVLPAGGIIPLDIDSDGRLALSWEHGWSALLLFRLSSAGQVSQALNVRRLNEEVLLKSGGDPWALDMEYALRSLSYGRFNVHGLSLLPVHEPAVPAGPGVWLPDNPFREPVAVGPEGLLNQGPLEEGFHRYRSGGGEIIDIHVTDLGWTWVNRLTGAAGSGTW